ncbi:iron ABC transporter [Oscillospiraceae bacterium]|nr:iron ABC transporter [Oscillospiraceae bacterium]BDF73401.1 iron ABC transporter [Oscillospiraceae bacterium]
MSGLLRLEHIHVAYGANEIIRDADLRVRKGEFCALLGLNGSGKTTLLHAVCGFIPMSGRVFVDDTDCSHLHEKKRARLISFIPQTSGLKGGRSVLDVVLMGFNAQLSILESPTHAQRNIAEQMLEQLGLGGLRERDFGTLSQGQRQLALLARCLVQDTPVMLMDEPDSALDFLNRHRMLRHVRDSVQSQMRAGLITLHDPNFAMTYCDRIFLLRDGQMQAELAMREATREEIQQKLSLLYGCIDIIPYSGGYLMAGTFS